MKSRDTNPRVAVEAESERDAAVAVTPPPVVASAPPMDDGEPSNGRGGNVPIGVSDGDFSTPTRRRRTVTRPRGLRTLEPAPTPAAEVVVVPEMLPSTTDAAAAVSTPPPMQVDPTQPSVSVLVTPPPTPEPTPALTPIQASAPPSAPLVATSVVTPPPFPPRVSTPIPAGPPPPPPIALRVTPAPARVTPRPQPPTVPRVTQPRVVGEDREAAPGSPTVPSVEEFLAAAPTPVPEVGATPPPEPRASAPREVFSSASATGHGLENAEDALKLRDAALLAGGQQAPDPVPPREVTRPSDPEQSLVDELLDQATAQLLESAADDAHTLPAAVLPTPPPSGRTVDEVLAATEPHEASSLAPLPDVAVAVSLADEPASGEALSPLAQTLAHMAASFQPEAAEAPDEIEIDDAPLVATPPQAVGAAIAPATRSVPPPLPATAGELTVTAGGTTAPARSVPEALSERPRRPRRSKPWYEEIFDEDYLRTLPFMTAEQTLKEVDFIEASLGLSKGAEVLDVACGYGRHAIELEQRGLKVTGIDLSLPLLIRAADESQRRALSVNFVHADMRELAFERQFDGAYCMLTSFGYFDEESNLRVAEGIARALKPGGRLLIDVVNRDYIVGDLPARVWWEGECSNSFTMSLDDGLPFVFGEDATYNSWHWVKAPSRLKQLTLSKGKHKLTIKNREDGVRLDQVLFVMDKNHVPVDVEPVTVTSSLAVPKDDSKK